MDITAHCCFMITASTVYFFRHDIGEPVAEGDSVTLGCKFKTENVSNVKFSKNDSLIQNDTRRELTIPAVSKSDEGFYKCKGKHSGQGWLTSSESWMSVKCEYDQISFSSIFFKLCHSLSNASNGIVCGPAGVICKLEGLGNKLEGKT